MGGCVQAAKGCRRTYENGADCKAIPKNKPKGWKKWCKLAGCVVDVDDYDYGDYTAAAPDAVDYGDYSASAEDADTVAQTWIGRGLLKKKDCKQKAGCVQAAKGCRRTYGRPPAAPHGHVLRRPTEEGVQQEAGLHQREGTWVPANIRERGQLRSHPQEEEEVVQ